MTQEEENNFGAHTSPLKEERMRAAREYGKMCDDDIPPHIHAVDFECGAIFGGNQMKHAILQWLHKNYNISIDLNKLLYESQ